MQEQFAEVLPRGTELSCDVCIVGSGAAAISIAHRLASTSLYVIMLESSSQNIREGTASEQLAFVKAFMTDRERSSSHRYFDPSVQPLYDGDVSQGVKNLDKTFLKRHRVRVYGGTTNCWGGWTRTLQPIDFTRARYGGPWPDPLRRDRLDRWYAEAQTLCSLPNFDLKIYDDPGMLVGGTDREVEPIKPGPDLRSGVLTTAKRIGVRDDGLDFQVTWGQTITCAPKIQLYRNANVRQIEIANGMAHKAVVQTIVNGRRGETFKVRAGAFVIAAGGVETPRLLMLSNVPNKSGTLGEGFMIHPVNNFAYPYGATFTPTAKLTDKMRAFYGSDVKLKTPTPPLDPSFRAVLIPTDEALKLDFGNFRAMIGFGPGNVNFNWEQEPVKENRIKLSAVNKDFFGDPVVDLEWKLQEKDMATLRRASRLVKEELQDRQGLVTNYEYTVNEENPDILMGDHPMGATRMSSGDGSGVVDPDCRVWGTNNLYIASSSVFPTGGWSNPTLTIVALARRLAAHLSG